MTDLTIVKAIETAKPFKPSDDPIEEIIESFNASHAVVMVGSRCCVLKESQDLLQQSNIEFLSFTDFKNFYANMPPVKYAGATMPAAALGAGRTDSDAGGTGEAGGGEGGAIRPGDVTASRFDSAAASDTRPIVGACRVRSPAAILRHE